MLMSMNWKRWYLYPPLEAFYTTMPALPFVRQESGPNGRATRALQCTQRPGDILFVPSLWGHATLNLKQSIGAAFEFAVVGSFPI